MRIKAIHAESKGTYGAPRIHAQLRREGVHCGKKRVARLMVQAGLAGRCPRRWRKTTIADPHAETRAVDLIKRIFGPDTKLDTRWVGDVTYISTWEGWAYLATVIDLASRRVVGWALADHMRTDLVADALRMACAQRRPPAGVIHHSDPGCLAYAPDCGTKGLDPIVLLDAILGTPDNICYWMDDLLAYAASHAPMPRSKREKPSVSPADLPERLTPLVDLRARALLRNALGDIDGAGDLLERLAEALRLLDEAAQSGIADRAAPAGAGPKASRARRSATKQ